MIRKIEIEIGTPRLDKDRTRRICRVVIDGERRGRLSLTYLEAIQLAEILATTHKLTITE